MRKFKKQIIIYSIAFLLVLVVCEVSHAYFAAQLNGIESVSTIIGASGEMTIKFKDNNFKIEEVGLGPDNNTPWATKTFTITGTNTTKKTYMPYTVSLVVDINELPVSKMSYTLESTNTSNNGNVIPSLMTKTEITGSKVTFGEGFFAETASATHTYQLKVYYLDNDDIDQSGDMGKKFSGHIIVENAPSFKVDSSIAIQVTKTYTNTTYTSSVNTSIPAPRAVELIDYTPSSGTTVSDVRIQGENIYFIANGSYQQRTRSEPAQYSSVGISTSYNRQDIHYTCYYDSNRAFQYYHQTTSFPSDYTSYNVEQCYLSKIAGGYVSGFNSSDAACNYVTSTVNKDAYCTINFQSTYTTGCYSEEYQYNNRCYYCNRGYLNTSTLECLQQQDYYVYAITFTYWQKEQ